MDNAYWSILEIRPDFYQQLVLSLFSFNSLLALTDFDVAFHPKRILTNQDFRITGIHVTWNFEV